MQGGPWYEMHGPEPQYVRNTEFNKIAIRPNGWANPKNQKICLDNSKFIIDDVKPSKFPLNILYKTLHPKLCLNEEEHLEIVKQSLLEVLPDDRENSWGSFRGYATFGIGDQLAKEIRDKCVENVQKALWIKREKQYRKLARMLKPHINRYF